MDTLGKRFHVDFLVCAHRFMSIRVYQIKDHSISVDQAKYATSIFEKHFNNATVNSSTKFYKTTFPADMIFTKDDTYIIDEQVGKLTREFKIHYIACIG